MKTIKVLDEYEIDTLVGVLEDLDILTQDYRDNEKSRFTHKRALLLLAYENLREIVKKLKSE